MSKCPCGGYTVMVSIVDLEISPHNPVGECPQCGFGWGVKG